MTFAFIIMGNFNPKTDRSSIAGGNASIIGVSNLNQACAVARELQKDGVGCIELCGAFGEDGARKVMEATGATLPVGYVVHSQEQDALFRRVFGE